MSEKTTTKATLSAGGWIVQCTRCGKERLVRREEIAVDRYVPPIRTA